MSQEKSHEKMSQKSQLNILTDVRKLILYVYSINFPVSENYGLKQQVRRAAVSIALNLREGNVFYDNRKLTHFQIALGSLDEVDECMLISDELNYINTYDFLVNWRQQHYSYILNRLKRLIDSIKTRKNKEV